MSAAPINYAALAEQARKSSGEAIDYAALAEQARGASGSPVAPAPRQRRADELGGPAPHEDSWGEKFGGAVTGGLLQNPVGGLMQTLRHPVEALAAIPGMLEGILKGDPETLGVLASAAPYALAGGVPKPSSAVATVGKVVSPETLRTAGQFIRHPIRSTVAAGADALAGALERRVVQPDAVVLPVEVAPTAQTPAPVPNVPAQPPVRPAGAPIRPPLQQPAPPSVTPNPAQMTPAEYLQAKQAAPVQQWDPASLPPDPFKSTPGFQRGLQDLAARRLGAPDAPAKVIEMPAKAAEPALPPRDDLGRFTKAEEAKPAGDWGPEQSKKLDQALVDLRKQFEADGSISPLKKGEKPGQLPKPTVKKAATMLEPSRELQLKLQKPGAAEAAMNLFKEMNRGKK